MDERLRVSRATGTIALACAPAVLLVGWSVVGLPESDSLGTVAMVVTYASFAVAMVLNVSMIYRHRLLFHDTMAR